MKRHDNGCCCRNPWNRDLCRADAMCNMYFISRFLDGLWKIITLLFMPHYFEHGFNDSSVKILWASYKNATSRIVVNGFLSEKFPIECSIWPKTKRHTIICLIVYLRSLSCAEWDFCHSTWLHGIPPACSKESRRDTGKDHFFGDYLEECTRGYT